MSSRSNIARPGFTIYLAMTLILAASAWAAEETKNTPSDQAAASDEAGSVQKALQPLLRISPDIRVPMKGESALTEMDNGAARRHDPDQHRNGLQHADAIRKSQSSLPIGDDINGPTANCRKLDRPIEPQPPINSYTHYFFSPYSYNRYRSPLSDDERSWSRYRYFGGNPSRYGYDSEYDRFDHGYTSDAGDVYRYGFLRGYDRGRSDKVATERTERVLNNARKHYERGLKLFQQGMYHQAARALRLAADTDQGDPVSRIYAAHAHFAIGRYNDAVGYLRRAFDLQPKIAMLTYDLREDYKDSKEFDKQLEELERAIKFSPRRIERLVLYGYILSYSGMREKAYEPLYKAVSLDRDDPLARLLLENCDLPPDVVVERIRQDAACSLPR